GRRTHGDHGDAGAVPVLDAKGFLQSVHVVEIGDGRHSLTDERVRLGIDPYLTAVGNLFDTDDDMQHLPDSSPSRSNCSPWTQSLFNLSHANYIRNFCSQKGQKITGSGVFVKCSPSFKGHRTGKPDPS